MSRQLGFKVVVPSGTGRGYTGPMYAGVYYKLGKIAKAKLGLYGEANARSNAKCAEGINICQTAKQIADFIRNDIGRGDRALLLLVSYETNDVLGPRNFDGKMDPNRTKTRVRQVRVEKKLPGYVNQLKNYITTHEREETVKRLAEEKKKFKVKK